MGGPGLSRDSGGCYIACVGVRPIHPGLFTMPDDPRFPRLLAGRCEGCGDLHFPRTEFCPYCGGAECPEVPLGEHGELHLFTVVENAPPGFRGSAPYGFGVVELPEGLRVVTRLTEARLSHLRRGLPVRLAIEPLYRDDDGEEVYAFAYAPTDEEVSS